MRLVLAAACATLLLGGCAGAPPTAAVGDCVNVPIDSPRVTSLVAIDCAEEHDIEVFALGKSTLVNYNIDDVAEQAQQYCRHAFEEYVGTTYEQSVLDIYLMYPDSPAWTNGDREIICAAYTPDPESGGAIRTVGSVANSLH